MKPLKIRRSHKTTLWVVLISLLLLLGQQYGWFTNPSPALVQNQPGLYQVTEVFDGDTIAVNMNGTSEKIRLIGVDTPETHDPRVPVQCFGEAASEFTKQLIANQSVRLEADPINTNRDRYDRLLRYVYLPDNRLVNAEIIRGGYGFAYTAFPFQKLDEFRAYEVEAREANRGLWHSCQPEVDKKGIIRSNPAD